MNVHQKVALLASIGAFASCGNGASSQEYSRGLKLFVTARRHVADFAHDPLLPGANAIEKADAFCNNDPNTPTVGTYKALLVDGILRDAKSATNWVLLPSTRYYRVYGDVEIGSTTPTAMFGAYWVPLTNAVVPGGPGPMLLVWTGIADPADFSAGADCTDWSSTVSVTGSVGIATTTDGSAFGGAYVIVHCSPDFTNPLYCVQQP